MLLVSRLLSVAALLCTMFVTAPSIADSGNDFEKRLQEAVGSCRGDMQCEAFVHKRETAIEEKRKKREAEDNALKQRDPLGYYLTLIGRFLHFVLFVCAAAGGYVLIMHFLFNKKRRTKR